ncbi:hypothetical protein LTR82_006168 [Friedmanniomyces endolithicus]|uniref:F-box domain-containing protein n=1 Tax=Friedmanniomyces endolithicus TaxID=329885 RepID=A0AAN6FSG7_9PEZI|nr:hypothetical protein LTR82_006168 [Friedmanniomyces endolithicus]
MYMYVGEYHYFAEYDFDDDDDDDDNNDNGDNGDNGNFDYGTNDDYGDDNAVTQHPIAVDTTACERVLGTAELHEQVLLKLPLRHLICAQAISRSWRNAIKSSPALRQALFLMPAKPTRAWSLADKPAESPKGPDGNGVLGPPARFTELDRLVNIDEAKDAGREYLVQAEMNEIIPYQHLHFSQRLNSDYSIWGVCTDDHPNGMPVETGMLMTIKTIRKMHPLHRSMYISQPPCKVVEFGVYGGVSQALVGRIVCEDAVGVTFQQLWDEVARYQAEHWTSACTEVALWMKDVSFVRRKAEVVVSVPVVCLSY